MLHPFSCQAIIFGNKSEKHFESVTTYICTLKSDAGSGDEESKISADSSTYL